MSCITFKNKVAEEKLKNPEDEKGFHDHPKHMSVNSSEQSLIASSRHSLKINALTVKKSPLHLKVEISVLLGFWAA
jgi:hypothetical protein